jgi:TatD DNase family protein
VEADLGIIESKLQKNCLALGECGWTKGLKSRWIATNGFEKQLLLAQKYNKPVVIHCVKK